MRKIFFEDSKLKPVVTIGLCVRNEEADVSSAVESVFNQDFPHELIEVIVVDGYSKDKTIEIVEEALSKGDIFYKIFFENEGLGHARQMVVENSRGDYIIWVDGDIRLSRSYTRKQIDFMDNNPMVGIAVGRYGIYTGSTIATLENLAYVVENYGWKSGEHPRLPPTEGSVFRVKAVRQAGGFDERMKGACEDLEVAYRMKAKGWLFYITTAVFYEKCVETWKSLWDQYAWWGYGAHYFFHKDRQMNLIYGLFLPVGFIKGLMLALTSYRITLRKISFLLPIHCTFRKMAWCFGFIMSHLKGYGHNIS
jgi:glycosyltransferase involved in cell wall biosynthesis